MERVRYILFLLEEPNKKSKKARFKKQHKDIDDYFRLAGAHQDSVAAENETIIKEINAKLKELTKRPE